MRDVGYKHSLYYNLKHIAIDEFIENFAKVQKENESKSVI